MTFEFKHAILRWLAPLAIVWFLAVDATAQQPSDVTTERKSSVNDRVVPESVDDLKALQEQVKKVVAKCRQTTVGIFVGNSAGSGVIIKKDDGFYVLTAGHVSGNADRDCQLVLASGRRVKGKTLGANNGIDSGLIKIVDKGTFDCAEAGKSKTLKPGQWVVSIGHPGGFQQGRTPVVRVGRILKVDGNTVQTDCTLVGGDSGGPLFDLEGRVIGIHSRIGLSLNVNFHVPVDTYEETWDRLVKSEVWGGGGGFFDLFRSGQAGYLGVQVTQTSNGLEIAEVVADSPAAKAGLKPKDMLLKIDGKALNSPEELPRMLSRKKPGDEIKVEYSRDGKAKEIGVKLGKRPS
jgi:serine protease Do